MDCDAKIGRFRLHWWGVGLIDVVKGPKDIGRRVVWAWP